jgi:hypothetical protein
VNLHAVGLLAHTRTASAGLGIQAVKTRPDCVIREDFTTLLFQFPDIFRDYQRKMRCEMYVLAATSFFGRSAQPAGTFFPLGRLRNLHSW